MIPFEELARIQITLSLSMMIDNDVHTRLGLTTSQIIQAVYDYKEQAINFIKSGYKPVEVIQNFMAMCDQLQTEDKNILQVSCKQGCAHCCHINVDATQYEVDTIVNYCIENDITINPKTLKKQKGLTNIQRPKSSHSACVFLGKDNLCKVYPVRPFHCRKYFAVDDPKYCDAYNYPAPHNKVKIYGNLDIEIITSAILNIDKSFGPMVDKLLTALSNQQNLNHGRNNT